MNEYCPATAIIENMHDPENRMWLQPGGHNHGAVDKDLYMPYLRRAIAIYREEGNNIRCYVYAYQAHIQ